MLVIWGHYKNVGVGSKFLAGSFSLNPAGNFKRVKLPRGEERPRWTEDEDESVNAKNVNMWYEGMMKLWKHP